MLTMMANLILPISTYRLIQYSFSPISLPYGSQQNTERATFSLLPCPPRCGNRAGIAPENGFLRSGSRETRSSKPVDGEVRRLGPGSVVLAEDTNGKGHNTRHPAGVQRLILIPFPDEL